MISKLVIALSLLAAVFLPAAAQPQTVAPLARTILVPSGEFLFVVSGTAVFKLATADLRIAGSVALPLPPSPTQMPTVAALVLGDSLYVARETQVFKIRLADVSLAAQVALPELLPQPVQITPPAIPPPAKPPEPPLPTSSSMMKE